MKTKLIKINDIYTLLGEDNKMIASDDIDFQSDYKIGKLSKKNCDEIFGVVDAGKLAEEEIPYSSSTTINVQRMRFIHGFNKAMELNKDKLFSQEDMYKMFIYGDSITTAKKNVNTLKNKPLDEFFNDFIQSLQQPKEIEVEIEMEPEYIRMGGVKGVKGSSTKLSNPAYGCKKTDENGCLILKKI
jgi:hypothetical protein